MRSSISSSETVASRVPTLPWIALLGGALLIAAGIVIAMELALRARGFRPTIVDSQAQWERQRERAAQLGSHALIVVGDSRMQADMDLDALRATTNLEPVELAIDGSPFVPILAGLAGDERINGTVLVGFDDAQVESWSDANAAARYEADYEAESRKAVRWSYRTSENFLADHLRAYLTSYADGTRPLTALLLRLVDPHATPQHTVTLPDRTHAMDFADANLRSLRMRSALYELEGTATGAITTDLDTRERVLRARLDELQPADMEQYRRHSGEIEAMVRAIQARGGRVVFVRMPVGGYLIQIEQRRFPRAQFWDRFVAASSALCLRADDEPQLRTFATPDDLHLDQRDRHGFSTALAAILLANKHAFYFDSANSISSRR